MQWAISVSSFSRYFTSGGMKSGSRNCGFKNKDSSEESRSWKLIRGKRKRTLYALCYSTLLVCRFLLKHKSASPNHFSKGQTPQPYVPYHYQKQDSQQLQNLLI